MARAKHPTDAILRELRAFGLAYPGAHTKSPWPGHLDLAVNDKTFAYLSLEGEPLGISCKLPQSHATALMLPFTEPTPYGLGKSGWVSARFTGGRKPSLPMLKAWIDESYRAQAPKRLVARLTAPADSDAKTPTRATRRASAAPGRKPTSTTRKPTSTTRRPASSGRKPRPWRRR
jgi:YjbR protein